MKKYFYVLLASTFLVAACNSDDDAPRPSGPMSQIEITMENQVLTSQYYDSEIFRYADLIPICNSNSTDKLSIQHLERFNTFGYRIEVDLIHHSKNSLLQAANPNEASLDYIWDPGDCAQNFELVVRYYNSNYGLYLPRQGALPYSHTIDNIALVEEGQEHKLYLVSGSFQVAFKQTDNSNETVSGTYQTHIKVNNQ